MVKYKFKFFLKFYQYIKLNNFNTILHFYSTLIDIIIQQFFHFTSELTSRVEQDFPSEVSKTTKTILYYTIFTQNTTHKNKCCNTTLQLRKITTCVQINNEIKLVLLVSVRRVLFLLRFLFLFLGRSKIVDKLNVFF